MVGRFAQHLATFEAAARAGNYLSTARIGVATLHAKHAQVSHHSMSYDVLWHSCVLIS